MKKEVIEKSEEGIKKLEKGASEFKTFISKGNVVDMAVGVIIGSAFGKIVTSLVNDVLMPLIGVVLGGLDFSNLSIKVGDATVMYGSFIQSIVDFLIVAFCTFLWIIYSYFMGYVVKGWSSIMLSIWFCSGCVLMGLGIVGEYIGKIYIETKERPRYNIESILMD